MRVCARGAIKIKAHLKRRRLPCDESQEKDIKANLAFLNDKKVKHRDLLGLSISFHVSVT